MQFRSNSRSDFGEHGPLRGAILRNLSPFEERFWGTWSPLRSDFGEHGPTPLRNPGTTPLGNPGTTPLGNPGTTPLRNPGTTPLRNPGTTPLGNPGTTPLGNPGTTPLGNPGPIRRAIWGGIWALTPRINPTNLKLQNPPRSADSDFLATPKKKKQ